MMKPMQMVSFAFASTLALSACSSGNSGNALPGRIGETSRQRDSVLSNPAPTPTPVCDPVEVTAPRVFAPASGEKNVSTSPGVIITGGVLERYHLPFVAIFTSDNPHVGAVTTTRLVPFFPPGGSGQRYEIASYPGLVPGVHYTIMFESTLYCYLTREERGFTTAGPPPP